MARPKKSANVNVEATATTPQTNDTTASPTAIADKALDSAKGRFAQVVIVGLLENGIIDVATSNPNYAIIQWLLDRAKFNLHTHEEAQYVAKKG